MDSLTNKRLMGIDFGTTRVGIAVCDSLHISITPQKTLLYQNNLFWCKLLDIIKYENIGGIVVGTPFEDNEEHAMRLPINNFIVELKKNLLTADKNVPIFTQDESFTSINAAKILLDNGTRKKKRSTKGTKDRVAAALILKFFLEDNN